MSIIQIPLHFSTNTSSTGKPSFPDRLRGASGGTAAGENSLRVNFDYPQCSWNMSISAQTLPTAERGNKQQEFNQKGINTPKIRDNVPLKQNKQLILLAVRKTGQTKGIYGGRERLGRSTEGGNPCPNYCRFRLEHNEQSERATPNALTQCCPVTMTGRNSHPKPWTKSPA